MPPEMFLGKPGHTDKMGIEERGKSNCPIDHCMPFSLPQESPPNQYILILGGKLCLQPWNVGF